MRVCDKLICGTPCFGLAPVNGACGLNCPPEVRGIVGASGFEEGLAETGGTQQAVFYKHFS